MHTLNIGRPMAKHLSHPLKRLDLRQVLLVSIVALLPALTACDPVKRDWDEARHTDTVVAYQKFLSQHPGLSYEAEANQRILTLSWQAVVRENTVAGFERFLSVFPGTTFADEARQNIRTLRFEEAIALGSVDALVAFFEKNGANQEAIKKVSLALGADRNLELTAILKGNFQGALRTAVDPLEVERLITHFNGFEFVEEAVQVVEKLWRQRISNPVSDDRFRIADTLPGAKELTSSFTLVEAADASATAKVSAKTKDLEGSGTMITERKEGTLLALTETPSDRIAVFMLGGPVAKPQSAVLKAAKMEKLSFSQKGMVEFRIDSHGRPQIISGGAAPWYATGRVFLANLQSERWGDGTVIRFAGRNLDPIEGLLEAVGEGEKNERLTFVLSKEKGLVYVRGKGRIRLENGGQTVALSVATPTGEVIAGK